LAWTSSSPSASFQDFLSASFFSPRFSCYTSNFSEKWIIDCFNGSSFFLRCLFEWRCTWSSPFMNNYCLYFYLPIPFYLLIFLGPIAFTYFDGFK
jgi:hypothetical protein